MPEALREGPYIFFFYSNDGNEPRHVHVRIENRYAKFWIEPVELEYSRRMRPSEVRKVRSIIEKNKIELISEWDAFFGA
jgi:hypothetical protein